MDKIDPTLMSYLKGPYGAASLPSLNDVNKMQLALPGYGKWNDRNRKSQSEYIGDILIKAARTVLETMAQRVIPPWLQAISTTFNYNRTSSLEWACTVCHHSMAIFTVSFKLWFFWTPGLAAFCIFFEDQRTAFVTSSMSVVTRRPGPLPCLNSLESELWPDNALNLNRHN